MAVGWIIQIGTRMTNVGMKSYRDVVPVIDAPGKHVWITLADSNGQPKKFESGAVCRMALPNHKMQIVYATKAEAHAAIRSEWP
jgi:hypothetical protein